MADVDVKKLLNPTGVAIQDAVQGAWSAGRVAVAVYWDEIEKALQAGVPVAAIYRALHKAGLVTVTRQAFTRQVKARRVGARELGATAKPAAEPRPLATIATTTGPSGHQAPSPAVRDGSGPALRRPGIPDRPWRQGPHVPPDPKAVFRPRDPLADD